MAIIDRRMLGPIKEEMGGETVHSGSTLSISNNVAGYLLRATGQEGVVEGLPIVTGKQFPRPSPP